MAEFLADFVEKAKERNLYVVYAQVLQDDQVIGAWSRFARMKSDALTAFTGYSRMESYSMSKSVTAAGAGIAIAEGLITMDERVAESFPEWTYDVTDPEILAITVEDCLKMASGISTALFFRNSEERRTVRDWGRYVYEHAKFDLHRGTDFFYCNVNPYLISCLIERKYGANMLEYLRYRLFEPLDIRNPDMTQCPMGHTIASNGMDINCGEMLRFGQMILNGGIFRDKRIVPESFVKAAVSPQVNTGMAPYWNSGADTLDYGYYFWVDTAGQCSYAMGVMGQLCLILPEKNAVISVQSLEPDTAGVAELIWEYIVKKL